jgi:hypothetical protein
MRLLAAGTPGLDPALGSIIHFYHFRHWRMTGVAYELRDSSYPAPNTTLLSRAHGRTKEFKDRWVTLEVWCWVMECVSVCSNALGVSEVF